MSGRGSLGLPLWNYRSKVRQFSHYMSVTSNMNQAEGSQRGPSANHSRYSRLGHLDRLLCPSLLCREVHRAIASTHTRNQSVWKQRRAPPSRAHSRIVSETRVPGRIPSSTMKELQRSQMPVWMKVKLTMSLERRPRRRMLLRR